MRLFFLLLPVLFLPLLLLLLLPSVLHVSKGCRRPPLLLHPLLNQPLAEVLQPVLWAKVCALQHVEAKAEGKAKGNRGHHQKRGPHRQSAREARKLREMMEIEIMTSVS